ncbi:MAG: zinc-binding dehydrogenase [Streptomycetaceae bacterium]|nr:zinc-binding dehydrogenase [Streptomycetaceae bacterium]
MRALVLRAGGLVVDDISEPEPDAGQVLVAPRAAGICGSDLHLVDVAAQAEPPGPDMVLGHEFCCEIVDHGPGTDRSLPVGTLVCSLPLVHSDTREVAFLGTSPVRNGAFAERMVLNERLLLPVPNGLPAEIAALTEPMAVGWHAVAKARLDEGVVPLVIGCGPVGLAVIAALKVRGVGPVVAADFSPARRRLAETMGADVVLDPAVESPYDRWADALVPEGGAVAPEVVAPLLGWLPTSRPAVVFECVGVPGLIQQVMTGAPRGAQVVVVGACMEPDSFLPIVGLTKELQVQFAVAYTADEFAETLHHLAEGHIDGAPLITGRVELDGGAQAFADLRNPEEHAKILVEPWR